MGTGDAGMRIVTGIAVKNATKQAKIRPNTKLSPYAAQTTTPCS